MKAVERREDLPEGEIAGCAEEHECVGPIDDAIWRHRGLPLSGVRGTPVSRDRPYPGTTGISQRRGVCTLPLRFQV